MRKKTYLESRKEFLNPQKVISYFSLKPDFVIADFGCGSGFFALPLAKALKKGIVVGVDIQLPVLEVLSLKIRDQGLKNIKLILGNLEDDEGSGLRSESCNVVLISNLLFQVENKEKIIKEAKRILKKKGMMVIIDWDKLGILGPEKKERVDKKSLKEIAKKLKLKTKKEFKAGDFHFGVIFEK